MPLRRKATPSNAAALPASRLPLGTPFIAPDHSPPPSRTVSQNSQRSVKVVAGTNNDSEPQIQTAHLHRATVPEANPSPPGSTVDMSLAEAKLARQNKRIQQAEAALTATTGTVERQTSRGTKPKIWKPFDFNADATSTNVSNDCRAPLTGESRVNVFRPPTTRESSMSRSMSSLSQRTTGTMQSTDSAIADVGGFHLYTTRKHRRNVEELSAYEEKPEEKQTTVEATIDPREIYNVFGNALPGQEFITQNTGYKDGQLQFLQHPNGDVSAHQWSTSRFIWENIGQFSNIRKKVEGQLAADRLKGETAHQTLQQHTLAYFRTIAKQREASVMGLTFGAKEIHALMPDVRQSHSAPTPKKAATVPVIPSAPSANATSSGVTYNYNDNAPSIADTRSQFTQDQPYSYEAYPGYTGYGGYSGQQYPYDAYGYPYHVAAPSGARYQNQNLTQTAAQDTFYASGHVPRDYGAAHDTAAYQDYGHHGGANTDLHGLDYSYSGIGFAANPQQPQQQRQAAGIVMDPRGSMEDFSQIDAARGLADYYMRRNGTQFSTTLLDQPRQRSSTRDASIEETATPAPRPKPVTPLSSRTAMRDHLMKLGNQAKERSLSQANIRTVLYDPFRIQSSTDQDEVAETVKPVQTTASPELKRTVANPSGLPAHAQPTSTPRTVSGKSFCPTVGSQRTISTGDNLMNATKQATPDAHKSTKEAELNGPIEPGPPTPQVFNALDSDPWLPTAASASKAYVPSTRNHDEQLHEWWFHGNTFARHDASYKRIIAGNNSPTGTRHATQSFFPSIASPAKPSTSEPMTRLLLPVLENLTAYVVQGDREPRRDYFCQWSQPPEWAIDRSPNGNKSFYDDKEWGQPPARVGRDPRYRQTGMEGLRFGGFGSPQAAQGESRLGMGGLDRRFAAFG